MTTSSPELPADVYRLGSVRLANEEESTGAITVGEALANVAKQDYRFPNPSPYLVVVTTSELDSDLQPITDRLAWLIRWDDLSIDYPTPTQGEFPPLRYGYVLIDAHTGKVMSATYME